MSKNREEHYPSENGQLVVRANYRDHLPGTEVYEVVHNVDDEIDLRELLDVLIRRKWIVLAVMLFLFFSVALITFSMTPIFQATGSLKVSAQTNNPTKFDSLEMGTLKGIEFQQTQVKLLQSEHLAGRVIDALRLTENEFFNPAVAESDGKPEVKGLLATLRDIVRPSDSEDSANILSEEAQQRLVKDGVLASFKNRFTVSPVKNSELINILFDSPDPVLSADVVNTAMREFINMHMDSNLKASEDASRFLDKQILAAQIKLEKSEMALQEFARKIGVVSLDPSLNMVFRQMEELNSALAGATAERIRAESRYQQAQAGVGQDLSKVLSSQLIQNLKTQYSVLNSEYEELKATFKPGYPKMVQIKARMDDLLQMIEDEKVQVVNSIKSDYEAAVKTEENLRERAEMQKQRALDLEEKATQYKIYKREVETNKSVYNSLLQRAKEVEATVGAAVTNIQVVDEARPPLYPCKPKVPLNLMLGLVLGALAGIAVAFVLEFFDNTVKSPGEMSDRLHIPVLGIIPYDKSGKDDRKTMALKSFNEPRSAIAESVRTIMASVRLAAADSPPKIILVTSVLAGAGKSSFSSNASLSCLTEDESCLLIDTDLRKPSLHNVFNKCERGKGLSSVLSGMAKLGDVITKTEYDNLHFISSGPLPPNPAELLSSKRMRKLLELVSEKYDRIILDGPPYQGFAEVLVLSNMADGVVLIAVEGDTPREGVKHFRKSVLNVGGIILGAVINKGGRKKGYGYSYGGYNYYEYSYGREIES